MFSIITKLSRFYLKRPVCLESGAADKWLSNHQEDITLISTKSAIKAFQSFNFAKIILYPPIEVDALDKLVDQITTDWVVALGGGQTMDTAKYLAKKAKKKMCAIPSVLSTTSWLNMGIAIRKNNELYFPAEKHANLIIIDPDYIVQSPPEFSLGGLADILCAVDAITDWKMAWEAGKEKFSQKGYQAFHDLVLQVMANPEQFKPFTADSVVKIYNIFLEGLALCGGSFSGRPVEGPEHLLFYCIDSLGKKSYNHGKIIALCILISLRLQGDAAIVKAEEMKTFFEQIGVQFKLEDINLTQEDLTKALGQIQNYVVEHQSFYSLWNSPDIFNGENSQKNLIKWVVEF